MGRPFAFARFARLLPTTRASTFDLAFVLALLVGGSIFHSGFHHWAAGIVGGESYGDAHFWWDGAVRVSEAMGADHPGKGFRPGYFVIAGLALPALGTDPVTLHKFLVLNFLGASAFLYFALRQPFGRLAAAAGVGLLVINPFTAEWIATTTTDGLGLTLHLTSLACLLVAVQRNMSSAWLCGFGVFFAVANLTRPLLTPFIAVVVLALLLGSALNWRGRLRAAVVTFAAFAVPTVSWMAVQSAWVGEWSLSTNDASALYAASTPAWQVWAPGMYDEATISARVRYGVEHPTLAQINAEFKRQARKNYYTHRVWHLERAVPHVWTVASFAPSKITTPRGTEVYQWAILSCLAAALAGLLLARGFVQRAALLATLAGVIWLSPHAVPFFTLAGCGLALLRRPGRTADLGPFLLACFWLVGVLALFLTGGTWRFQGVTSLNALGARVGSQFFFAGDLLACAFLVRVAQLNLPAEAEAATLVARIRAWVARVLTVRFAPAAGLVTALLAVLVVGDGIVFAIGLGTVAQRAYVRKHTKLVYFPDAGPVIEFYKQNTDPNRRELAHVDQAAWVHALLVPNGAARRESPDVLAAGTTGSCVWEMTGQQRSQTYFYAQQYAAPVCLAGGYLHVELPIAARTRDWGNRQGAFVLRGCVDRAPTINLPYYMGSASVRGFVPLKKDRTGYDFDGAVWFPLTRYASQLEAAGDLTGTGAVTWANGSGPVPFQRRAQFVAKGAGADGELVIKLDRAIGRRTLRFGWHKDGAADGEPELQVWATKAGAPGRDRLPTVETNDGIARVEIDCTAPDLTAVVLSFRGLPAGGVWVYELNLTADDFKP